jgi:hypothetical protein
MFDKRINIFIGHFGSGKTEVALNYIQQFSRIASDVTIVDLDIVNPFFRTSDAWETLNNHHIKLIKPVYANTNIDVPALPPEINSVLENKNIPVIFDVGGDDLGARAISCYKNSIEKENYDLFFVINLNRPLTSSKSKIKSMLYEIESTTRLKITKLVNNTNLLQETLIEDILKANHIIKEICQEEQIDFGFLCAKKDMVEELSNKTQDTVLTVGDFIKLPWDQSAR